ncbi:conserved hypothetical protein [Nitrosococcus halophilus Nc 4]|uniref:Uncharacterized protein n=1 Tax=Nitrosococcus halophilus (strain Nc4) TaxID=472759 RepID=D5BWH8_NITHN|nr:hypothetical protein [Nitrosococcus halophilus]ADE15635.1 conserved hypothetical protein [Nitrosococcus halophilus Nc 4]
MTNKRLFHIGSYIALFSLFFTMTTTAYAYGGGRSQSQSSSCTSVRFSEENPAPKAVIPELSHFSFVASSNLQEATLAVEIRDQEGILTVTKQPNGSYLVEGDLPEPITEERYARIDISAQTVAGCPSHHHYLVKIEPPSEPEAE